MMDAGDSPAETYRQAEARLRMLLLGDGTDTVGQVKGEEQRKRVLAGLRAMRSALDAALANDVRRSGVVGLEEDLQSIASFRSRAHHASSDSVATLVTPAEAAEALRVSVSSIYRAVRSGEIRAVRLTDRKRGALRIPTSELQRLFEGSLAASTTVVLDQSRPDETAEHDPRLG